MKAEERAVGMIKGLSDSKLFDQWELTTISDDASVSIVRGWLMDEIERRFPEAFDKWLDGDAKDETLRGFCM